MSDETTHTRPRIRTYAGDLEVAKAKQTGYRAPIESTQSQEPAETPKAQAPTALPNVPRIKDQPSVLPIPKPATPTATKNIVITDRRTKLKDDTANIPQTAVPAYHELQKEVQKSSAKVASELANAGSAEKAVRANIGYDTAIITDTKSGRFQFFPALFTSIKSWFSQATKRKRKAPTYTVPDASRRKGVIQKATTKTGTIFTADNDTLREQIRRRQQEQKKRGEADIEEDISWSPYTGSVFPLLESPEGVETPKIGNIKLEFKKRAAPTPPPPEEPAQSETPASTGKLNSEQEVVTPVPVPEVAPVVPIPPPVVETPPVAPEVVSAPQPQPQPQPSYQRPATTYYPPAVAPINVESPILIDMVDFGFSNEPEEEVEPITLKTLWKLNTNFMLTMIIGALLGVGLLVTAIIVLVTYFSTAPDSTNETTVAPSAILGNTKLRNLILDQELAGKRDTLITSLRNTAETETTEAVLLYPTGSEADPEYLFGLLGFRTLPGLAQSFDSFRVVNTAGQSPTILLTFPDKDIVLGGMLNWEPRLLEDVAPFYQFATTTADFSDQQIGEHDVRVAESDQGVLLLYGFIDDTSLIITSSADTFSQVATRRTTHK